MNRNLQGEYRNQEAIKTFQQCAGNPGVARRWDREPVMTWKSLGYLKLSDTLDIGLAVVPTFSTPFTLDPLAKSKLIHSITMYIDTMNIWNIFPGA